MIPHLLRRLGWSLFTIWAVVTATFLIYNVLPEDPARVIAGPQARPADVARIRTQLGLDKPVHVRYWKYMSGLVRLAKDDEKDDTALALGPVRIDLGVSYLKRKPVVALLEKALPPTLLVGILAIAIQIAIGAVGGMLAAMRRHTVFDWGTVALTLVGLLFFNEAPHRFFRGRPLCLERLQ